ncbi:MAG: tail fiber domain-containing protein [Bacteroidales bacterium]
MSLQLEEVRALQMALPAAEDLEAETQARIATDKELKKQIEIVNGTGGYIRIGYDASINTSHRTNCQIAIGTRATTGSPFDIAIGESAEASGAHNIAIGYNSKAVRGESIAIGYESTASANRTVAIGKNCFAGTRDQFKLGTSFYDIVLPSGEAVTSDARQKVDIADIKFGLDYINKLKPKSYRLNPKDRYYKTDENGSIVCDESGEPLVDEEAMRKGLKAGKRTHFGLLAQEVEQMNKQLGLDASFVKQLSYNEKKAGRKMKQAVNEEYALSYTELIPVLIKAVQELSERVRDLEGRK